MSQSRTVAELMQLRTQIDTELQERLSQHVCLLFADVVGSSAFFQKHGDIQGRFFVQRHHDMVTPLIASHAGRVVKTVGDGMIALFETPERALDCALAIQQQLWQTRTAGHEVEIPQTKISLHYGQALIEAHDVYGDLVNMSARLLGMAEPNQLLISQTVYERVKGRTDFPMLPLSTSGWKEGEKSMAVYEVLWQRHKSDGRRSPALRRFAGEHGACFYCGLAEHHVRDCPSKQGSGPFSRLKELGYRPLTEILTLFQQEDLHGTSEAEASASRGMVAEAFYEITLPYQLRFVPKVWLATSRDDWSTLERNMVAVSHPLAGTRLWLGLDCLRVGRHQQARTFLKAAYDQNPDEYKPSMALGFLALEEDDLFMALQWWRKSLSLARTPLQTAYMHLLLHRLYDCHGKIALAYPELQKALAQDRYLSEARYRQLALLVKEDKVENLLLRLRKLIEADRTVYVKVMLDPAYAAFRERCYPCLVGICQEAREKALASLPEITEALHALRAWYPQPEGDLLTIERAFERLRQHIKSDSYFGYDDAAHAGAVLLATIRKVFERRKLAVEHEYRTRLRTLEERLGVLMQRRPVPQQPYLARRAGGLMADCKRLQKVTHFPSAAEFGPAWEEFQKLKAGVEAFAQTLGTDRLKGRTSWQVARALLPYAVGVGMTVDSALFGLFGYLVYFAEVDLPSYALEWGLGIGGLSGLTLGSALGWFIQRYRRTR